MLHPIAVLLVVQRRMSAYQKWLARNVGGLSCLDSSQSNGKTARGVHGVQGCVCESGYTLSRGSGNIGCRQVAGTNLYYLIFASAILLIILPLIIVLAWPQLRARWATLKDRWWSKSGAPGKPLMVSAYLALECAPPPPFPPPHHHHHLGSAPAASALGHPQGSLVVQVWRPRQASHGLSIFGSGMRTPPPPSRPLIIII